MPRSILQVRAAKFIFSGTARPTKTISASKGQQILWFLKFYEFYSHIWDQWSCGPLYFSALLQVCTFKKSILYNFKKFVFQYPVSLSDRVSEVCCCKSFASQSFSRNILQRNIFYITECHFIQWSKFTFAFTIQLQNSRFWNFHPVWRSNILFVSVRACSQTLTIVT